MLKRIALLASLLPAIAAAGTITVRWTNPTQYSDGSTLAASAITGTRVEYGSCAGSAFGTKAGDITVTGAATTATINNVAPGTYCVRAYTSAGGAESGPSGVASTGIAPPPPPAPNPPSNLAAAGKTAFTSVKQTDRLVMLPVGTVPTGTECVATEAAIVGGIVYYVVPRSAVAFSGTVRPDVVYSQCS